MLDIDVLLGTINNQIVESTAVDGTITSTIMWDIPYITRAVILILSLWFFYKLILGFCHSIGGKL